MKIVNREIFLQMPIGTVYQKYKPCVIESHLSIKGESIENDWFYQPLNSVDATNDPFDEPNELDLSSQFRDGYFDEDQLFVIWSADEVDMLIARLNLAQTGKE